jgi:hypothetical protein
VPVESMKVTPRHVDIGSVPAQRLGKDVSNRHIDFPTDGDETWPVQLPDIEFERSPINRRARFVHCVCQIVGHAPSIENRHDLTAE